MAGVIVKTKNYPSVYGINKGEISGFYYDIQKNRRETSITLHANTEKDTNGKWVPWGEGELSKKLYERCGDLYAADSKSLLEGMSEGSNKAGNTENNWSDKYGAIPIATSILNEDFLISINNTWSDVSGNNNIENMWKTLQTSGPLMGMLGRIIKNGANEAKDSGNYGENGNKFLDGMASVGGGAQSLSKFLNNSLVVQGNRFAIYLGTNTDFLNLSMKFTLFSDWMRFKGDTYKFVTVQDLLEDLYPYFLGQYESVSDQDAKNALDELKKKIDENVDNETLKNLMDQLIQASKDISENLDGIFGILLPPAGFEAQAKNIDACLKGTFRLILGGKYSIENLVGQSMNVTLSKTQVKVPPLSSDENGSTNSGSGSTKDITFAPQYAEVVLNFKCASSFSNNVMKNFTSGLGSGVKGTESEINAKYTESLLEQLDILHEGDLRDRIITEI